MIAPVIQSVVAIRFAAQISVLVTRTADAVYINVNVRRFVHVRAIVHAIIFPAAASRSVHATKCVHASRLLVERIHKTVVS